MVDDDVAHNCTMFLCFLDSLDDGWNYDSDNDDVAVIMMVMMMMKFGIHITIQGRCTVAPPIFNKTTL